MALLTGKDNLWLEITIIFFGAKFYLKINTSEFMISLKYKMYHKNQWNLIS